jgi:hypothetical protein
VNHHFLRTIFDIARSHNSTIKVISGSRKERIDMVKMLL